MGIISPCDWTLWGLFRSGDLQPLQQIVKHGTRKDAVQADGSVAWSSTDIGILTHVGCIDLFRTFICQCHSWTCCWACIVEMLKMQCWTMGLPQSPKWPFTYLKGKVKGSPIT